MNTSFDVAKELIDNCYVCSDLRSTLRNTDVMMNVSNALEMNRIVGVICIFPRPTMGEAIPPDRKPAAPRIALASPACLRAAFMAMVLDGASMSPKLPVMANRQISKSQAGALRKSAAETQMAAMSSISVPENRHFCGVLNLVDKMEKMPIASAFVPNKKLYCSSVKP